MGVVAKVGPAKPVKPSIDKKSTPTLAKDTSIKKYEGYRAALEQALSDDEITAGEENLLKMLRSKYNITDDEHKMLEVQIKLEKEL